jgi:hypothetical protein
MGTCMALALLGTPACSVALDASEVQCTVAQDCADRGFAGALCVDEVCVVDPNPVEERWKCLGNIPEPMPQPGVIHHYRQPIFKVVDNEPPAGMRVNLCQTIDVTCETPILEDVPADADGTIEFDVESGFEGYLEITSDETMPTLAFFGPPIVADVDQAEALRLVSQSSFDAIVMYAGFETDPQRGHALALLSDCSGHGTAGVSMEIDVDDPATQRFFLYNLLPDPNGTVSDDSGNGGYLNIPVGFANITSTLAATQQTIAITRFQVRAGTLSYVPLVPTYLD